MLVIGIVGPPAGGKSTVAQMLAELGAAWVNADRLAHYALRLQTVKKSLRNYFGPSVFNTRGLVNRVELGRLVFGDDATKTGALEYIEGVIHPVAFQLAVRQIQKAAKRNSPAVVIDAPLLIEANWHLACDEIWCVDSPVQLRKRWIANRSWTENQLQERERRQLTLEIKKQHSTQVIDNSGEPRQTELLVSDAWKQLMEAATDASAHC